MCAICTALPWPVTAVLVLRRCPWRYCIAHAVNIIFYINIDAQHYRIMISGASDVSSSSPPRVLLTIIEVESGE